MNFKKGQAALRTGVLKRVSVNVRLEKHNYVY